MPEISVEAFYNKLETSPYAVRGFFETIIQHFSRRNDVYVHHTLTNGGDLRLAIPGEVVDRKVKRNFATLYWQSTKQVIFARTYLTLEELKWFGFEAETVPTSNTEPLNSDIRLLEKQWRYGAEDFIKALEAAKFKMIAG